jgi:hypothetical protein
MVCPTFCTTIRSDNGTEFITKASSASLLYNFLWHRTSSAKTPATISPSVTPEMMPQSAVD